MVLVLCATLLCQFNAMNVPKLNAPIQKHTSTCSMTFLVIPGQPGTKAKVYSAVHNVTVFQHGVVPLTHTQKCTADVAKGQILHVSS